MHLPHLEIGLSGTKVGDVNAFERRHVGGGIPHGGLTRPIPTNAVPLDPRTITLSIARRT